MINEKVLNDIVERLQRHERRMVRVRIGEVTDDSPLSVALGGSDISYTGVKSIGDVAIGDKVVALLFGNDMVVLGTPGATSGGGSSSVTIFLDPDDVTKDFTVTHGLASNDVDVTVIENNNMTLPSWNVVDANTVAVHWAVAPSSGTSIRVIVER